MVNVLDELGHLGVSEDEGGGVRFRRRHEQQLVLNALLVAIPSCLVMFEIVQL
jgi:hypothetical protein